MDYSHGHRSAIPSKGLYIHPARTLHFTWGRPWTLPLLFSKMLVAWKVFFAFPDQTTNYCPWSVQHFEYPAKDATFVDNRGTNARVRIGVTLNSVLWGWLNVVGGEGGVTVKFMRNNTVWGLNSDPMLWGKMLWQCRLFFARWKVILFLLYSESKFMFLL